LAVEHDDPHPEEMPLEEIRETILIVLSDLHSGQETSSELLRTSSSKILLQFKHWYLNNGTSKSPDRI